MSIILSKKLEDEVLKDNFPSSFSIEPKIVTSVAIFLFKDTQIIAFLVNRCYNSAYIKNEVKLC